MSKKTKKIRGKSPDLIVVDELAEVASDLSEPDRRWAEAISKVARIDVAHAAMRVRRIRYDEGIQAKLVEISRELGPNVVITNIEWTGPERNDLEVSVLPVAEADRLEHPGRGTSPSELTIDQVAREAKSRAQMRLDVARFELRRAFGPPRTHLGTMGVNPAEWLTEGAWKVFFPPSNTRVPFPIRGVVT